jgi:hypothetical protein
MSVNINLFRNQENFFSGLVLYDKSCFCYGASYLFLFKAFPGNRKDLIGVIGIDFPFLDIFLFVKERGHLGYTAAAVNVGLKSQCFHCEWFFEGYNFTVLSRRLLATTDTELRAMAAPAIIGLRRNPFSGYSNPAATGIPIML